MNIALSNYPLVWFAALFLINATFLGVTFIEGGAK